MRRSPTHAVVEAGYEPEVVKAYGWAKLPRALNFTPGRKEVRELTGSDEVPVLVLDDGEVVAGTAGDRRLGEGQPGGRRGRLTRSVTGPLRARRRARNLRHGDRV